jgi:hypothetical protein
MEEITAAFSVFCRCGEQGAITPIVGKWHPDNWTHSLQKF